MVLPKDVQSILNALRKSQVKQVMLGVVVMGVCIAALGGIKTFQILSAISAQAAMQPPPEAVTSFIAAEQEWQDSISATGSLSPVQGVTVATEEAGKVVQIAFESGSSVQAGDLLVALDSSVEEADLAGARAELERAALAAARTRKLLSSQGVAKEEAERTDAERRKAEAQVHALEARIRKKRIVAPFAGTAGIRLVNLGEFLAAGAPIVPLHSLEDLYVDFSLAQRMSHLIKPSMAVAVSVDNFPERTFRGVVSSINPEVDASTRTVMVRAKLPNPEKLLRPGMFARIELLLGTSNRYITLPATAISYAPFGDTVFVIEKIKSEQGMEYLGVKQEVVKLGPRRGDQVAIVSGIRIGQEVVSSGVFKLRPGAAVVVNNSVIPSSEANPMPKDT